MKRINKITNVGRFSSLKSGSGTQGDFSKVNVVYAPNGSGKSTLCDVFRSLGTNRVEYLSGRKRLGSTGNVEAEILLSGSPIAKVVISGTGWTVDPPSVAIPNVFVFDERFVSDNVFVGHAVLPEQRRNLYGLVLGDRARALKDAVDSAELRAVEYSGELSAASVLGN